MRYTLLQILILLSISSNAATKISGNANSFKGETIKAFIYKDFISNEKQEIGYTQVKDNGEFSFEINLKQTQYCLFYIARYKFSFYAEPDSSYNVLIKAPDQNAPKVINHDEEIDYTLLSTSQSLNNSISRINLSIDSFFTVNYKLFLVKAMRTKTDSFRNAQITRFSNVSNPYLKTYLKYALASLDLGAYHSNTFLYQNYFSDSILYNNYDYGIFFNEFFDKYLLQFSESKIGNGLKEAIANANYIGAWEIFNKDKFIENEQLRELVFIKGLFEFYTDPEIAKAAVYKCLQYATSNCISNEHRIIAKRLVDFIVKFSRNNSAPNFQLKSTEQKEINLKTFKGKKLILCFGAAWSTDFISEMMVLEKYDNKFGNKVKRIIVCIDNDIKPIQDIAKKNKWDVTICSMNTMPELLQVYNIHTIPQFFLINESSLFIEAHAEMPSKSPAEKWPALVKLKE